MSKRKEQPYTDRWAGKPSEGERGGVAPKRRTIKSVADKKARRGSAQGGSAKGCKQHQAGHHTLGEAAHGEAAQTAASTPGSIY